MAKKACKKTEHQEKEDARFKCKKCGLKVKKKDHACKPKKLKTQEWSVPSDQ